MSSSMKQLRHCALAAVCSALLAFPTFAQSVNANAPDLDLAIHYYSRALTAEGVLRESSYDETMLRRPGHVWVARVLPQAAEHAHEDKRPGMKRALAAPQAAPHSHKHFNHAVLPRHVVRDGDKVRLEFVDTHEHEVVSIAPSEYENVNFDGSWTNAFFLLDPQSVAALPLSKQPSPVAGARWHEQEKNGVFQRVLWDDTRMIPLVVESGNRKGSFFRRIEVKPQASLSKSLPWQSVQGYAQKEYADFLD